MKADPAAEVLIERMTWPDIEAALAAGTRTVIIAAGATEQHGPHLPEGTDAFMGEAIAVRVARILGNALVAPVIRPGCSDHHLEFPGTISVSAELLMAMLDAYVSSLRRHGFDHFVVFSSHGGNFPVLARWRDLRQAADVTVVPDRQGWIRPVFEVAIATGTEGAGKLHHSDAFETSQILALHPKLVHLDRAQRGYVGSLTMDELFARGTRSLSPNGILGDPSGASAEIGEAVLASVSEYIAAKVPGCGAPAT